MGRVRNAGSKSKNVLRRHNRLVTFKRLFTSTGDAAEDNADLIQRVPLPGIRPGRRSGILLSRFGSVSCFCQACTTFEAAACKVFLCRLIVGRMNIARQWALHLNKLMTHTVALTGDLRCETDSDQLSSSAVRRRSWLCRG